MCYRYETKEMRVENMTDLSKIDSNFEIKTKIDKADIKFHGIDEKPFNVYGIFKENGKYRRMPEDVAKSVSEGVYILHSKTAGGRVRFVTDSNYVAISASMSGFQRVSHCAFTGAAGFDMYENKRFVKTFIPPFDMIDGYESVIEFDNKKEREITINFPLFAEVKELYIGLQEGAVIKEASPYKNAKQIVYYGSSVTQGGCASRPGMTYEAIVSREFDYDYVNLGFSGNAKAEDEIADYIKNLDMSIFVYDYDYNAPSVEHLKNTHEKMFKTIREKQPHLPIIIMSRPKYFLNEEEVIKRRIIESTYLSAVSAGDKNVYFIGGEKLTELCKDTGTVDGVHPSDFGFVSMAKAVAEVLVNIDI